MSQTHSMEEPSKGKAASKPKLTETQKQPPAASKAETIRAMQQSAGNTAVQRLLAQRSGEGAFETDEETAASIRNAQGGGQTLEEGIANKAGQVMGQDFSQVNVHTDSQADQLNRQLSAKAFTTGNDIFFRQGEYNPGSSEGQRLISHELTHVVQQGASTPTVQGKMTVNDPNDAYEAEADRVAEMVMQQGAETAVSTPEAARQEMPEEELLQQQPEEEEMLQQQAEEEEMPPEMQMQEMPEEELPDGA